MSRASVIGVALLAATVGASPLAATAADPTQKAQTKTEGAAEKAESKTERAVEKTKATASEAKGAISDSWLTAKTKIALAADERVKARQVGVDTRNGVVALRGKVDSAEAKSAAEEIAKGIDGVKGVKNNLQVTPPSQRAAVDANDKEIKRRVKERVSNDARLKKADIEVQTDAGVVTLKGDVPNITASARASELARQVPGVRAVKNELAVKNTSK